MALNRDEVRQQPRVEDVPVKFVWFSGPAFDEGQEVHNVEGVEIRVYAPGKTVADLFKYRRKIGIDVAIEALEEGWRNKLFTMDELDHYASVCGVRRVMKPYLQTLTAIS